MARADRSADRAGRPITSQWDMRDWRQHLTPGPLPLRDFLPRLRTFTRLIPVRVWRQGGWQVIWVVIRSVELVHVASNRTRNTRHLARRRQA